MFQRKASQGCQPAGEANKKADELEVQSRQTDRGAEDLGKAKTVSDDADEQENRELPNY